MTHSAKLHVGEKMFNSFIQSKVDIYGKIFHIHLFYSGLKTALNCMQYWESFNKNLQIKYISKIFAFEDEM